MRRAHSPVALTLAFALATPAATAWHFEDALRGSTRGNQVGGMIAADGWHVTDRRDRIWYAVPRLVSGSVEFTVTGLTMASLGSTADNEIFAMYEGGWGIAEPIRYAPEFRENHYKCMLRIYSNGETGREGFQKLMWGLCPDGAPGYGTCACGRTFFDEPFAGPAGWDGSAQRIRVEWGDGHTRYLRNGRPVINIDWSSAGTTFAPSELHVSLGTSRPSAVDTAQLPVGVVFSDLVIDGTEGPLAVCPSATPDAGAVDAAPPVMTGNVLELPAVEDVTVDPGNATTVYPDVRDLSVGAGDSEFYVKFRGDRIPGRVTRAQLILHSAAIPSAEGSGASIHAAASSSWSESTLTWNARPGPTGARLARIDGVAVDTAYTVELPPAMFAAPGTWAFAVLPEAADSNSAHFDAREVSSARGPTLRLTLDTSAAPDATVTPPDATVSPDVPTPVDATTRPDAAPTDTPAAPDANDGAADVSSDLAARREVGDDQQPAVIVSSPGCGCHVGGGRADATFSRVVLGALLAFAGRRRRFR